MMATKDQGVPSFLKPYAALYAQDPRAACRAWMRETRFNLFLHYGLYSLLGRHEWVQFRERIPVADYATLADWFSARHFDVEAICQLALEAEMKSVGITTRHHDSFCLWDTKETSFSSVNSACGRDLIAELAAACDRHGLGLCLYYSHGRDWKHPHAPNNDEYGPTARPHYEPPEATYATGAAHDLNIYLEFMKNQLTELLTQYGPVATVWLDGLNTPRQGDMDAFRVQELYDHIHSLQPQVLLSYKTGWTGTEDYFAPEQGADNAREAQNLSAETAVEDDDRLIEVAGVMRIRSWGWQPDLPVRTAEDVWQQLAAYRRRGWNFLLNTGPRPDGSVDPEEAAVLRALGKRIREQGYPGEAQANG
jgi:alpha-L-fucosidase